MGKRGGHRINSMNGPERNFSPLDPEFAFIGMSQAFTGINYPSNSHGLRDATIVLTAQHEKVMPPVKNRMQLIQLVSQNDPVIRMTEQMFAIAIDQGDYESALYTSNHLFAYGDVAYQDLGGGEAFDLSLRTHRALAEKIKLRFSAYDPYLRVMGSRLFAEIDELRKKGDHHRELELLRGLIHTTALNETLGKEAKQYFDPFAIVQIN